MARKQGTPPTTHTIEEGDTLFDIAEAYYGEGNLWTKISEANGNLQPDGLQVGQKITIPSVSSQPPTAPPETSPTNNKVVVYQHAQYQGDSKALEIGEYSDSQLQNDSISSLKVPSGLTVTLYEHTRFGGSSKTFTTDTPYVGDDFNDKASSIVIEAIDSTPPTPFPVGGFEGIVSAETFDAIFPNRQSFYTYNTLVTSALQFSRFCTDGTIEQRKREAAAFLAHVAYETEGLSLIEEENTANWPYYCQTDQYPCAPDKTYHGRGPIQLSWNYNYARCGEALGLDLLNNPEQVATDSAISFMSALWFWMTPQSFSSACHDAMNTSGFGATINILSNGRECGQDQIDPQAEKRIQLYEQIASQLSVSPGDSLSC